jgi:ectoine hydroxylase-related dioxygenase (phytanoyl-CoA dioxygenase family)
VAAYARDGAVVIRRLRDGWVDVLRDGVEANLASPGQPMPTLKPGEAGPFFDEYRNWSRIPQFREAIFGFGVAEAAARLMGGWRVPLFQDHVLVEEPGTAKPTPWHSGGPYYVMEGRQTVSFWAPLDPVREATLRCIAGSHLWPRDLLPTRWMAETSCYPGEHDPMPLPDPEADGMRILEWDMEPGHAVAFHFRTLHGARDNTTDRRRRALSLRLVGEDARYVERPGPTSPLFPGRGMRPGERLREDWFPVLRG